jgi:hypothetical protein
LSVRQQVGFQDTVMVAAEKSHPPQFTEPHAEKA